MAGSSHSSGICIKWNNHHHALVKLLHTLLENKKLLDVTIAAEGKFLKVHRVVLCASSPYFEELLGQHDEPALVILQNVKFCDLELLVEYMYKGEIALMEAQLVSLLEAAESLQIQGLTHTKETMESSNSDDSDDAEENFNQEGLPNVTIDAVMEANSDEEDQPVSFVKVRRPRTPNQEMTIDAVMETNSDVENQESNSVGKSSGNKVKVPKAASSKKNPQKMKPKNKKADSKRLYKCDTCGRDYQHKIFYTRHLQKGNCQFHPYFRCSLCDACENNRAHLRQHLVRFHRGVEFAQLDDYIIEVEPSLPKFSCDMCPYRCKDVGSLRKHKKAKHNNNGKA